MSQVAIDKNTAIEVIKSYDHYNSSYASQVSRFMRKQGIDTSGMNQKEFDEWLESLDANTLRTLLEII